MNANAIRHDPITGCYALDKDRLIVKLETGKEVSNVILYANDPYVGTFGEAWYGEPIKMKLVRELKYSFVWEVEVAPKFKRLQYYFEISCDDERVCLLEDGLYSDLQDTAGRIVQYFKYAWLNGADVCEVPKWAENLAWYQIFPDRFCRADGVKSSLDILQWGVENSARFNTFYGGNITGITEKLEYIKDLGIGGIYLTPIMLSNTNHRYNVNDYTCVDPDLGGKSALTELIKKAHGIGLKIMLDAVFNHCGKDFFAWRDVEKNGAKSKYYDWFFINDPEFASKSGNTKDGRYFSFSFEAYMPKLNTNNPEVADYFINVCKDWVALGVDGIRFDVGNEISHTFLKKLRLELKALKPDLFLLGEIWHRAQAWLLGDEYDSIMNFQFLESVNDFYIDKKQTARDLMYSLNENYNNYYRQINGVLFNMLDNHDVDRAVTRCNSQDSLLQELVILMTMPGSPCIYYGTETALGGVVRENRNRRCMDWNGIDNGKYDEMLSEFKKITALRQIFAPFKNADIEWRFSEIDRVIDYIWSNADGHKLEIVLNASECDVRFETDKHCVYSRKLDGDTLSVGGIVVLYE